MNMIARESCVTNEELAELVAGRLPPDRFAQALEHVDTCEVCSAAAAALPLPAAFTWGEPKVPSSIFAHEPECQAMVGQLLLRSGATEGTNDGIRVPVESLGPYRLLKWLGSGGMGAVYLAEHQRLKRLSAIKLLPREKLLQSDWLARFNREMTSIAALEHPHVVRAIDAGDQAGWHYLVMEYLDGADLSKVCRSMGQLPVGTACELVRQASLGLAAIHALGMTHRDIKPSNMFLTRQGVVKLLDLGLVLSGDSPLVADERLTTVGHLMGTLPYMAREQLLDASDVDWRTDIYSLGATLFRMLTARAPLGSTKNLAQTIQAITTCDCPKLEQVLPDAPRELAELVNRMLSHDRTQRPQRAEVVAELLAKFSEAHAPRPLIRTALSQLANETESAADQFEHSLAPLPLAKGTSSQPPSHRTLWLAAAILPIAFFAGIIMTLVTDKGTLVIESEEPGVSLKVSQGNKVVDTLKVENQSGAIRLYSGTYVVEVLGATGDGLELSDSQVTVTRGQKQVLHVHKKPQGSAEDWPDGGKSYQGKSFSYWMAMLDREKDVAMIAQAMQAVALLAETDAEKIAAAKKSLLPARNLGGVIITGRPEPTAATNLSGWYMKEFTDNYAAFLPEPGFEAIVDELEQSNQRSAMACLMLLSLYANRQLGWPFGMEQDVKLSEHLTSLAGNERGRRQLERLDKACEKWAREPDTHLQALGIDWRLAIADLLGTEQSQNSQLVAWAHKKLREANETMQASSSQRSPISFMNALSINKVLRDDHSLPLLLGLLERTPIGSSGKEEARVTEVLRSIAENHPQAAAEAIVVHLKRLKVREPSQGPSFFIAQSIHSPMRAKLAKVLLLSHAPNALELVRLLSSQYENPDSGCIFEKEDIIELLQKLAIRLEQESHVDDDALSQKKDCIAIYLWGAFGLPSEAPEATEAIAAIVAKNRSAPNSPFLPGEHRIAFSQFLKTLESDGPSNFVEIVRSDYLTILLEKEPEKFIQAFVKRLASENYRSCSLLDPLFRALVFGTEEKRKLYQRGTNASLAAFVQSTEARASIEALEAAYRRGLKNFLAGKHSDQVGFAPLSELIHGMIVLNHFLKRDVEGAPFVKDGLDLLFQASKNPERKLFVPVELLSYYGQHYGYSNIPFELLSSVELQISSDMTEVAARKLVKEVCDSRPADFCDYFTKELEQFADRLDLLAEKRSTAEVEAEALMLFGGGLRMGGSWYEEMLGPILANTATKQRAIEALKRICAHLPSAMVTKIGIQPK